MKLLKLGLSFRGCVICQAAQLYRKRTFGRIEEIAIHTLLQVHVGGRDTVVDGLCPEHRSHLDSLLEIVREAEVEAPSLDGGAAVLDEQPKPKGELSQ